MPELINVLRNNLDLLVLGVLGLLVFAPGLFVKIKNLIPKRVVSEGIDIWEKEPNDKADRARIAEVMNEAVTIAPECCKEAAIKLWNDMNIHSLEKGEDEHE